jgi:hypothetical protein
MASGHQYVSVAHSCREFSNGCTPLQASLLENNEDDEDRRPLLKSNDSHTYGIISPVSAQGEEEVMEGTRGRYTPVGKSFEKTEALPQKNVWQLPHKDYDVSDHLGVDNIIFRFL